MEYRRDYVLQMIEEAVRFAARIAGLLKSAGPECALEEASRACRQLVGVDRDLFLLLSDDELLDFLRGGEQALGTRALVAAHLASAMGQAYEAMGSRETAAAARSRALFLFLLTLEDSPELDSPDIREAIDALATSLDGWSIGAPLEHRLAKFQRSAGES